MEWPGGDVSEEVNGVWYRKQRVVEKVVIGTLRCKMEGKASESDRQKVCYGLGAGRA